MKGMSATACVGMSASALTSAVGGSVVGSCAVC